MIKQFDLSRSYQVRRTKATTFNISKAKQNKEKSDQRPSEPTLSFAMSKPKKKKEKSDQQRRHSEPTTTFKISKPKKKTEKSVQPPSEPFLFKEARSSHSTITAHTSQSDHSGVTKRISNTKIPMIQRPAASEPFLFQEVRSFFTAITTAHSSQSVFSAITKPISNTKITMTKKEEPLRQYRTSQPAERMRKPLPGLIIFPAAKANDSHSMKKHQQLNHLSPYALKRQPKVKRRK
jgi:hypothetical protein